VNRATPLIAALLPLLFSAGAAAANENGHAAPSLASIGVLYDVDAPFGSRGRSLSVIRPEGSGYVYETYSKGLGLARLAIASDALESTRFDLDNAGQVRATEYLCRSCDFGNKGGLMNIAYDWTSGSALFTSGGEELEFALEPRAMDRKAWEIQKMVALAAGMALGVEPTIEGGKLKLYSGERMGEETLDTGAGEMQTVKYRRQREGSDNFQFIWYARELGWLPARWEIWRGDKRGEQRKDRRMIIIEAYEYHWGEDAALAMRQDWLGR